MFCYLLFGVTSDSTDLSPTYGRTLTISLSNVALNSTLTISIGIFQAMSTMLPYECQVRDLIPMTIGQLSSLQSLNLESNSLSGPIPTSFGNLQSLDVLMLSINKLIGPIPDTMSFSGSIPFFIGSMTLLTNILSFWYHSECNKCIKIAASVVIVW